MDFEAAKRWKKKGEKIKSTILMKQSQKKQS